MNYSYRFPAVKGVQANREYYISMVPIKLLPKLFQSEDEYVLPEFRAQRRINESRIPEIKKYILENRDNYVFSALSASIDGQFNFIESSTPNVGVLEVDMESVFLINDGQHRKAAIEAAMNEDPSLNNESISVVFFKDDGLVRSQQMFTDLNKHAVKTSNSLATLYDTRDPLAVATKRVVDEVEFFRRFTDKERDILGKNSSKLFTLNTIYKANQKLLHGKEPNKKDTQFLINYWQTVSNNITEWQELMNGELTKKALREHYIITFSITICSLGKLGRAFYDDKLDMEKYLSNLKKIDWSRTNKEWRHRVIREDGKINNSEEATTLICSKIKSLIGLDLTKEEKCKEKQMSRR